MNRELSATLLISDWAFNASNVTKLHGETGVEEWSVCVPVCVCVVCVCVCVGARKGRAGVGVEGEHSVMGQSVDLTGKRILTRIKWSGAEESGTINGDNLSHSVSCMGLA